VPDDVVAFTQGRPPTLIHVNHVYTIGFAGRLNTRLSQVQHRIPMIVETHDVQAHIIQDNGEKNPWTRRPDSLARLIRSEIKRLAPADVLIHLTQDDLEFFAPRFPDKPHVLAMPMMPHVPPPKAASAAAAAEPIDVLFVGTGHVANLEAVDWLFREVWPHIAHLGLTLRIAGHIDELVRLKLPELYHEFRAFFTGPVADVAPYYAAARCLIAPMVSGRGISIKTIEALAFGKPIVGTSKAYRGMPMDVIQAAGLRPCDDARDFADAIVRTLRTETIGATRYRALYDRLFSKSAYFRSLDEATRRATAGCADSLALFKSPGA
jgi:glycosyltransferase involved in cell wall biosynthesis